MERNESVHYEEGGTRYEVRVGREDFVQFRDACKRASHFKREMDEAIKEREKLQPRILELIATIGQPNIKVGGSTIYLHRQLWANAHQDINGVRNYQAATDALIEAGFPELVETKFNVMRVSALVREMDKQDDISPVLEEGLEIKEKISARIRG